MPKRIAVKNSPKANKTSPGVSDALMEQVAVEARLFTEKQLGLGPKSVFVSDHRHSMSITMFGLLSEAEKNAAKDKLIADLIVKKHTRSYNTVREMLEIQSSTILDKTVSGSSFILDPESNCATILLSFKN